MLDRLFRTLPLVLALAVSIGGAESSSAQDHTPLEVPSVFSDHCVLQRDMMVPVWGRATPGAEVVVAFADQVKKTTVDAAGMWRVDLDPMEANSSSQELAISSGKYQLEFEDVLVGEDLGTRIL